MSLGIPADMTQQYAIGDGINNFKTNFINFIMPSAYSGSSLSVMTLISYFLDPDSKFMNLTGVADKKADISLI